MTAPARRHLQLVDADEVPTKTTRTKEEWLALFKSIPTGKAIKASEEDLGANAKTVRRAILRYTRQGLLPGSYEVVVDKVKGTTTLYIVRSGEPVKGDECEG